jgi:hypothetical protein
VKRDVVAAARLFILPTFALLAIVLFLPGRLGIAVRIYALLLCAAAIVIALAALRRAYPHTAPLRAAGSRRRSGRRRPPSLARVENVCALGVAGSFDLHHRLRPRVRTTAAGLLATRRRVSLDREPESARRLLGEKAYDLVRADRPPPEDRLARGLPISDLRRIVESLESV